MVSLPRCPAAPLPQSDYISFRHHTYEMPRGVKSVELKECGPRFELKLYQVGWGWGGVGGGGESAPDSQRAQQAGRTGGKFCCEQVRAGMQLCCCLCNGCYVAISN